MHWLLSQVIMMLLMYMAVQIVRRLKNKKAVGTDEIPSEVYASQRLLTIMSIFLSGCMVTGKLPVPLCTYSDHTATEVQI